MEELKNPLITVIMPCYNGEKFIEESIQSVLGQTYKNIELVVVNDGSKDRTLEICERIAAEDPRLRVISHPTNYGVSAARNTGLKNVQGSYITFVDSDDQIDPEFIDKLYKLITAYKADISQCALKFKTAVEDTEDFDTPMVRCFSGKEILESVLKGLELDYFIHHKLIATKLFDGLEYPVNFKIVEDAYVAVDVYLRANRVVWTNEPLYSYTFRDGSLMRNSFDIDIDGAMIKVHHINGKKILQRYPELKTLTEQRLVWAYLKVFDKLLATDNPDKTLVRQLRPGVLSRYRYVLAGNYFTLKRKIAVGILWFSVNMYRRLSNRKYSNDEQKWKQF